MATVTLFAWAVPAWFNGNVVDHTWVTNYDNRITLHQSINDVIGAGDYYWYSWGSFHQNGQTPLIPDGFLASGSASLAYARCLCDANLDSNSHAGARGTIFKYGVDGVCHQLTNQILWSTGNTPTTKPQTARNARGYWLSNALFGTYGVQQAAWNAKKTQCMANSTSTPSNIPSASQDPDDFDAHVREVLRGLATDPEINDFLSKRQDFMKRIAVISNQLTLPTAQVLNAEYNEFFKKAAQILGPANFERVFEVPPQDDLSIVDPRIYTSINNEKP